jgi:hypothetical protein
MTTPDDTPERLLHALRNRLNSLLMNAEVLRSRLPDGEDGSPFARHIEDDGRRCAELLDRLDEALEQEIVRRGKPPD